MTFGFFATEPIEDICENLQISKATLYRYLSL
ncbi:MAG: helix-turn-helix domain-containing protein [Deltaproteobacteria bacterium]|nr:helix-turn-helix domain-containing protein [Deltaproteobacteria bacterium]